MIDISTESGGPRERVNHNATIATTQIGSGTGSGEPATVNPYERQPNTAPYGKRSIHNIIILCYHLYHNLF